MGVDPGEPRGGFWRLPQAMGKPVTGRLSGEVFALPWPFRSGVEVDGSHAKTPRSGERKGPDRASEHDDWLGRDSTFRFDCKPKVTAHRKCRRALQEGLAIGDGALPDFVASRVPRKWRDVAASHEGETDHPSGTSPHDARMRGGLLIDFPFAGHRTDCLVTLETSNLSLWRQPSSGGQGTHRMIRWSVSAQKEISHP